MGEKCVSIKKIAVDTIVYCNNYGTRVWSRSGFSSRQPCCRICCRTATGPHALHSDWNRKSVVTVTTIFTVPSLGFQGQSKHNFVAGNTITEPGLRSAVELSGNRNTTGFRAHPIDYRRYTHHLFHRQDRSTEHCQEKTQPFQTAKNVGAQPAGWSGNRDSRCGAKGRI